MESSFGKKNRQRIYHHSTEVMPRPIAIGISTIILTIWILSITLECWIPFIAPLFILIINGIGLLIFFQYDRALKARIDLQQATLERTSEDIHNGPLQTLKSLIRDVRDRNLPQEQLLSKLETLGWDLRKLHEYLQQEAFTSENSFLLENGTRLDLNLPLHELLYQVYRHTLEQSLPGFQTVKITISKFEPVSSDRLNIEQKRGICGFLEEALAGVGKHSTGVTRLGVTFTRQEDLLCVRVEDNAEGVDSSFQRMEIKQAKNLARKLRGRFQRSFVYPKGSRWELSWPIRKL